MPSQFTALTIIGRTEYGIQIVGCRDQSVPIPNTRDMPHTGVVSGYGNSVRARRLGRDRIAQASLAQRKPRLPVELSVVLALLAATRYR